MTTLRCLCVAAIVLAADLALAQEALRSSMAGETAAQSQRLSPSSMPFTWRAGDFRLLTTPSLGLEWNDNVRLSRGSPEDDVILRPVLGLALSYPVTERNLLQLNVGVGYDKYFEHDDLSRWYVQSGSALSFDIFVGDFRINLHDRFSYVQDSAQQAAIANTGSYGLFDNTAGLSSTWNLNQATLTLSYDHQTAMSTSSEFQQTDRSSELFVARTGLRVHPRLTVGVEGSTSLTAYDRQELDNNTSYSGGVYGEWRPGNYFSLTPRAGYTVYSFEQTSHFPGVQASGLNTWYADVTVTHAPTEVLSYSLSAGHEIQLGIQSDAIEDWYVRPNATWSIFKRMAINTAIFYEHGTEQGARLLVPQFAQEAGFDWYGGSLGFGYTVSRRVRLSFNYRLTMRASDAPSNQYTQNVVSLTASYTPQ